MNAAGQMFDGYYYFGGENGVLVQEEGTTPLITWRIIFLSQKIRGDLCDDNFRHPGRYR